MLNIIRLQEPSTLIAYRQQPDAKYDGPLFTQVKADIRTQLLVSQGYLCAYCMNRITNDQLKTKVEHWRSQHKFPLLQLNYTNMLVVCSGNTLGQLHCDSSKGDEKLTINPADLTQRIESVIKYTGSGEIYVDNNSDLTHDIDVTLNLNYDRLKKNREAIMEAVMSELDRIKGSATRNDLNELLDKWNAVDSNGYKKPYCGTATYYIKKKIARI